jgi:large subunit ribosomal protein L6
MEKPTATIEKKEAPLSRLGRKPIDIPSGVKVAVADSTVSTEGPRGKLSWTLPATMSAKVEGTQIKIIPTTTGPASKALHGLSRKLVLNMVEGVTKGFSKKLVIEGVGFRAAVAGSKLNMTLGFSHPVVFEIPKDVQIKIDPKIANVLQIEGNDKQKVGQVAAQIRSIKKPEPYKGTGIRYENEIIKRKAGKAAVGAAGGGAAGGGGGKK